MTTETTSPRSPTRDRDLPIHLALDERMVALEDAADAAMLAPSVHGSQPWTIVLHPDRLELRADRSRQLAAVDPAGRELVQSLGAALFNVRVALAARGWAVEADRFPDPADTELVAVVRPVPGAPEARLPLLGGALHERRTHRAGFLPEEVPDELLDHLVAAAAAEDCGCLAVLSAEFRGLVAQLTQQADAVQLADPDCAADRRKWRAPAEPSADEVRRTVDSDTGVDRTYVLITSRTDEPATWLRSGEALERVLLELAALGWAASPMTQLLEVPATRQRLWSAMTGEAHPQVLLRIGFRESSTPERRRNRDGVVVNSSRSAVARPVAGSGRLTREAHDHRRDLRPVSDGRGGTTWV